MTTPNPSFPFDPTAAEALTHVPNGLVASADVLAEFLQPPPDQLEWFCQRAWAQAWVVIREDPAVTDQEKMRAKSLYARAYAELAA